MTVEDYTLPKGWAASHASALCEKIQDGTHFSPQVQLPEGRYRYVTAKNVRSTGLDLTDIAYLRPEDHRSIYDRCDTRRGDVLLVKDGVNTGDVAMNTLDDEISLLSSVCFLRPDRRVLSPPFLRYFLMSPVGQSSLTGRMTGTAIKRIVLHRIKETRVHIAPLNEQDRIVDMLDGCLSRLDDAVASLKRVQAKLKAYRASVLKAAVEGRLVQTKASVARAEKRDYEAGEALLARILKERRRLWEEAELARLGAAGQRPKDDRWKAKYREPILSESLPLPELPEGWTWARISTVGTVQLGRQRAPAHHRGKHMRPYLRVANVFEDRIDTDDVMTMNFTPQEFETYRLGFGDILLNEGQSPHLIGRPAMYRDEVPGACFQNTLIRFRATSGVDPRFALVVFRAQLHARRYMRIAQITTNIAHLGAGRFSEIEFPLPPTEEQKRIADEVERLMSITNSVQSSLRRQQARSARLRQSILKWAFEGKLVDQDPTDEPADALLARMREKRSLTVPINKSRSRTAKGAA